MKDGPERELVDDYLTRAQKSGKSLGYRAGEEIGSPSSTKDDEGARLLAKHGQGILIRLYGHGAAWGSQDLSKRLARWRADLRLVSAAPLGRIAAARLHHDGLA